MFHSRTCFMQLFTVNILRYFFIVEIDFSFHANTCFFLVLSHSYDLIFVLDIVLLLFFRFRVVQLNEDKVNTCSHCATHHGPYHRNPPPAASSSADRGHMQRLWCHKNTAPNVSGLIKDLKIIYLCVNLTMESVSQWLWRCFDK